MPWQDLRVAAPAEADSASSNAATTILLIAVSPVVWVIPASLRKKAN